MDIRESTVKPTPRHATKRSEPLVITLCSMPVPITIARPRSQHLARFSFFSSPSVERPDSYWVHMGYFSSRTDAQRWLKILGSDYPDAHVRKARSLPRQDQLTAIVSDVAPCSFSRRQ